MLQVSSLPATSTLLSCAPISNHARGWARPSITQISLSTTINIYSVFNMLTIFHAHWFVNRMHILSLALFAQKAREGNEVTRVEFSPQSHSYLVKQALALAPPLLPLGPGQAGHVLFPSGGCQLPGLIPGPVYKGISPLSPLPCTHPHSLLAPSPP